MDGLVFQVMGMLWYCYIGRYGLTGHEPPVEATGHTRYPTFSVHFTYVQKWTQ